MTPKHKHTMRRRRARTVAAAAAAAFALMAATAARAAPLDDIRRQVEASQFEQAWATAQANPQLIGDVHFDFPYGVAAIATGRVAEGLLALERHLAAVPANDRARLELARGYFLLGEYARARAEFEFVLRYNPPAGVRANIESYLLAMQSREGATRRSAARLYVEAGAAHDNNVNLGTFHDVVALDTATFSLEGSPSRQMSDDQALLALGGERSFRVTARTSVFAGADVDHRENSRLKQFNLTNANGYIGFSQIAGNALWRTSLGGGEMMVGGNRYRDTRSVDTEAEFTLRANFSVSVFGRYAEIRHAQADEIRDNNASTLGSSFTWRPGDTPGTASLGLRVSYMHEGSTTARPYLAHDSSFVRVFASMAPIDRLFVSGGLSARQDRYGQADPTFKQRRRDDWINADLLMAWTLGAGWSLRGEALWTINRSNIDLFDYGHKMASLKLRYQY